MRVIILNKNTVIDGVLRREGEVVQVDTTPPKPIKLKDNFTEDCIKKVLVGKPKKKTKPLVVKEEDNEIK